MSFRVKYGDGHYMMYASSGSLKCFECGDVGHKRFSCPHKQQTDEAAGDGSGVQAAAGAARAESEDALKRWLHLAAQGWRMRKTRSTSK